MYPNSNTATRSFLDTSARPDPDLQSTAWTVERDANGNFIYRPPSSQLTTQMCLNTEEGFGQPRLTAETTIKKELLEVQGYSFGLESTRKWAQNLRFLACVRSSGRLAVESQDHQPFSVPDREAVRELWLTEAGQVRGAKYLAISYCWKSSNDPKNVEDKMQYVVLDRGQPRSNKAPAEILDRAICIAAHHALKYIWIDQECIDQDNREDKELGIQSMDLVFERAFITAGLLSTAIETLEHAQALGSLWKAVKLNAYGDVISDDKACEKLFENHVAILETVEVLASDKWLTRSWILQEAASTGNRLILYVKCPLNEAWQGEGDLLKGEISIDYVHLHAFLEVIHHTFVAPPIASNLHTLGMKLQEDFQTRMEKSCNRLQFLSPQLETSGPRHEKLLEHSQQSHIAQSPALGQDLHRPTCNAAEALIFMSIRKNSRIEDRLAIVANLCKYPLRINTMKVQHPRFGLSVCIFTLALINGDLSLMAGISTEEWLNSKDMRLTWSRNSMSFSWLPPPLTILGRLRASYESSNTCRMVDHRITPDGLALGGYLWNIDQKVHFSDIQRKYGPFTLRTAAENTEIYWEVLCTLSQRGEHCLAEAIWQAISAQFVNVDYTRHPALNRTDFPVPQRFRDVIDPDTGVFLPHLPPLIKGAQDRHRLFDLNDVQRVSRGDLFRGAPRSREWVTRRILNQGFLWCGHARAASSTGPHDVLCALVDVDIGPCAVLTPHCVSLTGFPRDKIRLERMSWVVVPRADDGCQTLLATGMVRGLWDLEGLVPERFTLG